MKRQRSIKNLLQRISHRTTHIWEGVKHLGPRRYLRRVKWLVDYVEVAHGGRHSLIQKLPVDRDARPIPWITYPALEFLEQLDLSKCAVFEYGSGNSSKFWATRCRRVTSVEYDAKWFEYGLNNKAENQSILLRTDLEHYVKALSHHENNGHENDEHGYDIIVIDGNFRYDCAAYVLEHLGKNALIILDNADWFPNTCKLLADAGLLQIDFIGAGPINSYAWCTSFFFRRDGTLPRKQIDGSLHVLLGRQQHSVDDCPKAITSKTSN